MIAVYLAGPDVFAKDAVGILKEKARQAISIEMSH